MLEEKLGQLSRRERQIMDVIYKLGEATAAEVLDNLPEPPGYSAVRAMLRILEEKKWLRHRQDGPRYVFSPKHSREKARRSVVKNMLSTFFDGSAETAVATLLDVTREELTADDYKRIAELIEQAKQRGE